MSRLGVGVGVASLALLVGGCGGGGMPTDASVTEFCSSIVRIDDAIDGWDQAGSKDEVDSAAESAREVGVPADVSADARETYEKVLSAMEDNDTRREYDATVESMEEELADGELTRFIDTSCRR